MPLLNALKIEVPVDPPVSSMYPANEEKWGVEGKTKSEKKNYWWILGGIFHGIVGLFEAGERCGHVKGNGAGYCGGDNEGCIVKLRHKWCYRFKCAVCWGAARHRTVERVVEYVKAFIELCNKLGIALKGLNYAVFSPPQDWSLERMKSIGGIRYMRTKLNKIMRESGVKAGIVITHEFRVTKWAKQEFKHLKRYAKEKLIPVAEKYRKPLEDVGIWDWLRYRDLLSPEDRAIYFSCHYHVFYWGYLIPSGELYKKTGWIYKKIGHDLSIDEFGSKLNYVLSHTSVYYDPEKEIKEKNGSCIQMITRVGLLRKMHKEEHIESEEDICEHCNNMREIYFGWDDNQLEDGSWSIKEDVDNGGFYPSGEPWLVFTRSVEYWFRNRPDIVVNFKEDNDTDNSQMKLDKGSDYG